MDSIKSYQIPIEFDDWVEALRGKLHGARSTDSAWYNAVISKRANGAQAIPRRVMRLGATDYVDEAEFDGQAGLPRIDFADILHRASKALDNYGAFYAGIIHNRQGRPLEVRWFDPRTIKLRYDQNTGAFLGFTREAKGRVLAVYDYDETTRRAVDRTTGKPGLCWAWTSGMNEFGPGDTLADACKLPATALVMGDEVMNALFARGAINVMVAYREDGVQMAEAVAEQTQSALRRLFQRGAKNSSTVALLKQPLKFEKISTSPNELELGPSADRWQNDICAACDTPRILLNTADASNRATIDRITQTWLMSTIAPHAQRVLDALNFHVLYDIGYEVSLNTAGLDVDQQEEADKAAAWAIYVDRDVDALTAAEMLGLDIPDGMPFIDEARRAERQAAAEAGVMRLAAAANAPQPQARQEADPRRAEEVKRLGKFIKNGTYLERSFTSDILTTDEIQDAIAHARWEDYP